MTSQPGLERKMRQLDNDVQSIYEMLASIVSTQARHNNRFEELAQDIAAHNPRFDALERHATAMEERLTAVEERLTGVEERLTGVEEKLDTIVALLQK